MALRLAFYSPSLTELFTALEPLAQAGVTTRLCLAPPQSLPHDLEALGFLGDDPRSLIALRPRQLHALATPETLGTALAPVATSPESPPIPVLFGAPAQGSFVTFRALYTQRHPDALWAIAREHTDLAVTLHQQTGHFSLYDLSCLYLEQGEEVARARLRTIQADPEPRVVLCDSLTPAHTRLLGALFREEDFPFLVGSAAVEHTLLADWETAGLLPELVVQTRPEPVRQLLVVSGSPLLSFDSQLTWARSQGYFCHTFRESTRATKVLCGALGVGHSAVLYAGNPAPTPHELALALRGVLERQPLPRLLLYGTALLQAVAEVLELESLEWVAPLAPGAPLCRIHGGPFAGQELVIRETPSTALDFIGQVRQGTELPI